jgi:hypothetical protein
MHAHVRELAADQDDLVAAWQLLAIGLTRRAIDDKVHRRRWRVVHPGVYALTAAPLTSTTNPPG